MVGLNAFETNGTHKYWLMTLELCSYSIVSSFHHCSTICTKSFHQDSGMFSSLKIGSMVLFHFFSCTMGRGSSMMTRKDVHLFI